MSATNLNHWALGPAYFQGITEESLGCSMCGAQVQETEFCQECGIATCANCTVTVRRQAHCISCSIDAKKGGR
jgi:hypothetical protein